MTDTVLPEEERWIVRMRVAKLSYEAICEASGRSKDTIQRVLARNGLAPDPDLRGEDRTPTLWACSVCTYKCKSSRGHPNCQGRARGEA